MSDTPAAVESLLLEHMKRFQTSNDQIHAKLDEVIRRLGNLESGQASFTHAVGNLQAVDAQHQLSQDDFRRRLERIERRLELS